MKELALCGERWFSAIKVAHAEVSRGGMSVVDDRTMQEDTRAAHDHSDIASRDNKQRNNRRLFSAFFCPTVHPHALGCGVPNIAATLSTTSHSPGRHHPSCWRSPMHLLRRCRVLIRDTVYWSTESLYREYNIIQFQIYERISYIRLSFLTSARYPWRRCFGSMLGWLLFHLHRSVADLQICDISCSLCAVIWFRLSAQLK